MRLISYNILDGGVGRADPIAEILEASRADIITLLEADDPAVVERIAKRLKMDAAIFDGKSHLAAILSHWPIQETINHALQLDAISNCFAQGTIVDPAGNRWLIAAVHLHPHAAMIDEQIRMREIQAILQTMPEQQPYLLAGDFNANSPLQNIVPENCKPRTQKQWTENGGMLPREAMQTLFACGHVDTLQALRGDKAGQIGSFSTQFPGQRVDFILVRNISPQRITSAWVEQDRLARFASDHYPVGVEIT